MKRTRRRKQGQMESSKQEEIVSRNPNVMNGALVFAGTRVPVKVLMDHLAAGDSLDEFSWRASRA
jgi:uncharacterized protein (DUF433 family)